jgi:hypothetical protein
MAKLAAKNAGERLEIDLAADAPPLAPAAPGAIDRAHLARMTHGERDLEREVLQLYATQADILLARMGHSPTAAVAALAHTIKDRRAGSAPGRSRMLRLPSKRMLRKGATRVRQCGGWLRPSARRRSISWS